MFSDYKGYSLPADLVHLSRNIPRSVTITA